MNIRQDRREGNNPEPMLSATTRLLVAIAGAVSLNCKPCLEALIPAALQQGILPEEIAEVVCTVTEVRENVSTFTRDLITHLLGTDTGEKSYQTRCRPDCGCTQPVGSPAKQKASGEL